MNVCACGSPFLRRRTTAGVLQIVCLSCETAERNARHRAEWDAAPEPEPMPLSHARRQQKLRDYRRHRAQRLAQQAEWRRLHGRGRGWLRSAQRSHLQLALFALEAA